MAKSEFSKQRLLALIEILRSETDEDHSLGAQELVRMLASRGISAERKSIYRDIAALQDDGWDIISSRAGYRLVSREFELAELKLLADSVQCSRCITEKKSVELIRKLEGLTSRYNAGQLHRQLHLVGRSKTENEQIYYNVDAVYTAIAKNSEITFRYYRYLPDGSRVYREDLYRASPYGLCWDNESYYVVAHTDKHGKTHFRLDRMANITITGNCRKHPEQYQDLNMADYSKQVFGMFSGEPVNVRLYFPDQLADAAIDKFGIDTMRIPQPSGGFTVTVPVIPSPLFYSWVFSFSGRVRILQPQSVRDAYRQMCLDTLSGL